MPELKTDRSLLAALKKAEGHKLTPREIERQRVSFIMGSIKMTSGVTRERVQEVVAQQIGKDQVK